MRTPDDLKGKIVGVCIATETKGTRAKWSGFRSGQIVKVESGPRVGFRSVLILTPPPSSECPCPDPKCTASYKNSPSRVRVMAAEILEVLWFGKWRPLAEWMQGGAA